MKATTSLDISTADLYKLLSKATGKKVIRFNYHRAMDARETPYCTIEYEEDVSIELEKKE